jgi:methylisocitrate lyase
MKKNMPMTTKLRQEIKNGLVVAASCYDPFTARMAELAGFDAIHLTGYGHEVTQIGAPDLGIQTLTELTMQATRMAETVDIPILADIDTGFGGVLNVRRTIKEMERAGIAAVHMEDQTTPKRCPALGGVRVVSREEAVGRIKAACDARLDDDFIIVARSDASGLGFKELIERCNLYLEAGADMVMPMILNLKDEKSYFSCTPDEQMNLIRRVIKEINGLVMGMGCPPPKGYTVDDMAAAGYSFMMFAGETLTASANAVSALFKSIKETGNSTAYETTHPGSFDSGGLSTMKAVYYDYYEEFDKKYSVK